MTRRIAANRIQMALDALGIDWHSPRYGRPRVAGDATTILIEDRGAFGPMSTPLVADGAVTLDMRSPPARMSGQVAQVRSLLRGTGTATLTSASTLLHRKLGAPARSVSDGATVLQWTDQGGLIRIATDTKAERCTIEIHPGWRRPVDARETETLNDLEIVGRGRRWGVRAMTSASTTDVDSGFIRDPAGDLAALDGIVALGFDAIVACPGRLLFLPLPIIGQPRIRVTPGGGAEMLVDVREGAIAIAVHDDRQGLNLVARGLAKALANRRTGKAAAS